MLKAKKLQLLVASRAFVVSCCERTVGAEVIETDFSYFLSQTRLASESCYEQS